jgi:RNA polymerase sigma factor (sigma-70 family)
MSEAATAAGFSRLLSDDRLTRRAVDGDQRAFAAIFSRYHQALYRFCLALVGNPDDAQDALQNTMAKVLRSLPGEDREIELKPWLYRIAHNESIDLLRRRRETRELDVEQVAPGYGLAEDVATRERLRRLLDDLRELPERQREVLVMRELSGLDFEEIGTALGTSGAVARQTLYEARQSLQQMDEGREMDCDAVTKALSDGDGRVTRRRDIRAHLRSCAACRQFRDEIEGRQRDLAGLAPLPAVAAAGMLHGLLGGSQGATGGGLAATLGGGAAKTIGASTLAKGVATVAVVAAIGVTAADKSGTIHLGLPGDQSSQASSSTQGSSGSGNGDGSAANSGGETGASSSPAGKTQAGGANGASAKAKGHAHGQQAHHHGKVASPGSSSEHPHGRNHEKQHPAAATKGQETAATHAPAQREEKGNSGGGGGSSGQGPPPKPSKPPQAPSSPPKGPPSKPPAAAPEDLQPPASSGSAEAVSPGNSGATPGAGKGKGSEKNP